ncbi:ribosome-associated protein [Sulfitobacter undariae]|uniref:Ribosomal silencing factor RsfS n=1 Tax=Sulfitobacter undariae TaxID=1563671 RepID=A0A7W6E0B6_9RHOB|nr:ribosome silencing factor [Sulfitobacter undariae]MBB3992391.1 ribosome-associated protein [Sulfitobacter undariae]
MAGQKQATSDLLLETVLESLNDGKAEDVVQIDLRGKSEIGDYMIICSGRSTRQVSALSARVAQDVKDAYGHAARIEGKDSGDWVLVDTGDVIVHVFRPEVREFYQIEKMWLPQPEAAS